MHIVVSNGKIGEELFDVSGECKRTGGNRPPKKREMHMRRLGREERMRVRWQD